MNMQPVVSDAISSVGYIPTTRTLYIQFTSGPKIYEFHGVPESVYRGLMSTPLKGEYYNDYIRGRYQ